MFDDILGPPKEGLPFGKLETEVTDRHWYPTYNLDFVNRLLRDRTDVKIIYLDMENTPKIVEDILQQKKNKV